MNTKITLEHYDIKAEVTLRQDADLNEVIDAFKGMLIIAGWHHKGWENAVIEMANEYDKNID